MGIASGRHIMVTVLLLLLPTACLAEQAKPPQGFSLLFNGQNLDGWRGQPEVDPRKFSTWEKNTLREKQEEWDKDAKQHWSVEEGVLVNDGHGVFLTTEKEYGDMELLLEYRVVPQADSGIYLRGTPQVQIWDYSPGAEFAHLGATKGSGGLFNNSPGAAGKDPLVLADKPFGEWNQFRILQVGARTSVWLNGHLVVDHAIMENYHARELPLFARGPIQLQTHGGEIRWRNLFVREISSEEGNTILRNNAPKNNFQSIFNGRDLAGWQGAVDNYQVIDGAIVCREGKGGALFTEEEYGDFVVRLDFRLPAKGNNGLAIRYPGSGYAHIDGLTELQVLDSEHPEYATLDPRQYHGSAYGIAPAHRGYLRPVGDWNFQEVTVRGTNITVELNGTIILDVDLSQIKERKGNVAHPGLQLKKGYFGFAGHHDPVAFRNIDIRHLD